MIIMRSLILVCLFAMLNVPAMGGVANGLNIGVGLGASIPDDDNAYGGVGADFYPELQLMYDITGIRLGVTVGYVYREVKQYRRTRYSSTYDEYEFSFLPVKFNLAILPVAFAKPDFVFQPYLSVGAGSYIAVGDNDEDYDILSFGGGFEFRFSDWYNLSLEFIYNTIDESSLDYGTVMLINRFRIPFGR